MGKHQDWACLDR